MKTFLALLLIFYELPLFSVTSFKMENIFDEASEIQPREYEPDQRYQQERDSPSFADDNRDYLNEQEHEYDESDPNYIIKANHIQPGNSLTKFKISHPISKQNYNHFSINGIFKEKVNSKPVVTQNFKSFGLNGISKEKVHHQNNFNFKVPNQAIKHCTFLNKKSEMPFFGFICYVFV